MDENEIDKLLDILYEVLIGEPMNDEAREYIKGANDGEE